MSQHAGEALTKQALKVLAARDCPRCGQHLPTDAPYFCPKCRVTYCRVCREPVGQDECAHLLVPEHGERSSEEPLRRLVCRGCGSGLAPRRDDGPCPRCQSVHCPFCGVRSHAWRLGKDSGGSAPTYYWLGERVCRHFVGFMDRQGDAFRSVPFLVPEGQSATRVAKEILVNVWGGHPMPLADWTAWSDGQRAEAFGDLVPLLATFTVPSYWSARHPAWPYRSFSDSLAPLPHPSALLESVIAHASVAVRSVAWSWSQSGSIREGRDYFAPRPAEALAEIDRVFGSLADGFRRLAAMELELEIEGGDPWRSWQPCSLAVDAHGHVYVADKWHHRIWKLSPSGEPLARWGTEGVGREQFDRPGGVAVDGAGNVYVADTYNYRVRKLSPDGIALAAWGSKGAGAGRFSRPWGVAVDQEGNVYVADRGNHRIQKLSREGKPLALWGSWDKGALRFAYPDDVAVDSEGNVYVADRSNTPITKLSPAGELLARWGSRRGDGFGRLYERQWGVAVDGRAIVYVADARGHLILRFSTCGSSLEPWGREGSDPGHFNEPYDVAVDGEGNVYVADRGNRRVQKLSPGGEPLTTWGPAGPRADDENGAG